MFEGIACFTASDQSTGIGVVECDFSIEPHDVCRPTCSKLSPELTEIADRSQISAKTL